MSLKAHPLPVYGCPHHWWLLNGREQHYSHVSASQSEAFGCLLHPPTYRWRSLSNARSCPSDILSVWSKLDTGWSFQTFSLFLKFGRRHRGHSTFCFRLEFELLAIQPDFSLPFMSMGYLFIHQVDFTFWAISWVYQVCLKQPGSGTQIIWDHRL